MYPFLTYSTQRNLRKKLYNAYVKRGDNDNERDNKNIAMQIAASKPRYLEREEVPQEVIDSEKAILKQQDDIQGKPDHIIGRIVEGRLDKFYTEVCLLEQTFIRDNDKTIDQIVKESITQLGENIVINRFALYILGQS